MNTQGILDAEALELSRDGKTAYRIVVSNPAAYGIREPEVSAAAGERVGPVEPDRKGVVCIAIISSAAIWASGIIREFVINSSFELRHSSFAGKHPHAT